MPARDDLAYDLRSLGGVWRDHEERGSDVPLVQQKKRICD